MRGYEQSEELRALAERVIKENERFRALREGCRIGYQWSDTAKRNGQKIIYADTERVKEKLKGFTPYDFIITFYRPHCEALDGQRMEILMYHELLHVGYGEDGKCTIQPHDVEDFREIVERYGVGWVQ